MTAIYHITHIRNLASILQRGCLLCDAERIRQGLVSVGIAHEHIKQRRARRTVPTCCGGTLANYVPFYFAPRSPMLYSISTGYVEAYAEGQAPVLHLVSSVEGVVANGLPFTFTNGHAEMAVSRFYEATEDLNKVDWAVMRSLRWNDTAADGNRKWRRQAEFLVHNSFPFTLVQEIGVISETVAGEVRRILESAGCETSVVVRPAWYYL